MSNAIHRQPRLLARGSATCHLNGAPCGGNCFYSEGALRALALDGLSCKRCLASLAKRDREFQRKARGGLEIDRKLHVCFETFVPGGPDEEARDRAARAIAREEGIV